MLLRKLKFYNLRKKFINNYKKHLKENSYGVNEFKLDDIFDVKMHLPMLEVYDVLDNIGVNKLIKKIYKLKKSKNYNIEINYLKSKFRKLDYIQPQFDHTGLGALANIKFLDDLLIEEIAIVWTQINNEEAIIIYEVKFKKWINELKDINEYVLSNIDNLKFYSPTVTYEEKIFKEDNFKEIYNVICNMFSTTIQYKISNIFYTKLGKLYSLPLLNKYIVKDKNETISTYLKNPFLKITYEYHKDRNDKCNIYLVTTYGDYNKEYDEFIFGNSYSPGSTFLNYFSEYRMEFYYQVFDYIETNILERKMSKYLNSHKKNIKISDYKWLIKKVRQLGEKRLYSNLRNNGKYNMYVHSEKNIGKKFIIPNSYSKKFENVYNDNLNYIKEMNNVDYNYKIYIITIITLALTVIGTFATFIDFKKENSASNIKINEIESREANNMNDNNYLSYEEQFKEILNQDEISRIKNVELREVRIKYWNLRHTAFLDEYRIKDSELESVFNDLWSEEQKELEKFKNN